MDTGTLGDTRWCFHHSFRNPPLSLDELPNELNHRLQASETCLGCECGHPGMECVCGCEVPTNFHFKQIFFILAKTII